MIVNLTASIPLIYTFLAHLLPTSHDGNSPLALPSLTQTPERAVNSSTARPALQKLLDMEAGPLSARDLETNFGGMNIRAAVRYS